MQLKNVQQKVKKFIKGFTIIELIIAMAVISTLSVLITAQFRQGEKTRGVILGTDIVASAMRTAQNLALNPKQITTNCNLGNKPADYRLIFKSGSSTFNLVAYDKCGTSILLETYSLPRNVEIPIGGLRANSLSSSQYMDLRVTPPFAKIEYAMNGTQVFDQVRLAKVTVGSTDGSLVKYVNYSGTGRVDVTDNLFDIYSD